MAIKSVIATLSAQIDGSNISTDIFSPIIKELTSTDTEGEYVATIQAPNMSSYNLDQNVFYLSVTATTNGGNTDTVNQSDSTFGENCKLRVKEQNKPVVNIINPSSDGTYINNNSLRDFSIKFTATDVSILGGIKDSGIDLSSLVFRIKKDSETTNISYNDPNLTCNEDQDNPGVYIFSYKPADDFQTGNYEISVSISDFDGNSSNTVVRTFIVDITAPSITISAESPINKKSVVVNGTTDDTGNITVVINVNNSETGYSQSYTLTNITTSSFSQEVTLDEGTNTISAYATDTAGNTSPTTSITVLVDTTIPVFEIVKMEPNPVDNGKTLTITVRVKSVQQNE